MIIVIIIGAIINHYLITTSPPAQSANPNRDVGDDLYRQDNCHHRYYLLLMRLRQCTQSNHDDRSHHCDDYDDYDHDDGYDDNEYLTTVSPSPRLRQAAVRSLNSRAVSLLTRSRWIVIIIIMIMMMMMMMTTIMMTMKQHLVSW